MSKRGCVLRYFVYAKPRALYSVTHQIRVHSAFMGYPLLGDDLYGEASPLISRQALHCEKMTFQSPENGRIVTVTAPLPEDMLCLMTPDR